MHDVTKQIEMIGSELLKYFGNANPTERQIDVIAFILNNFITNRSVYFDAKLSAREKSCLFWAAMGKTSEETADLLKISVATVESHRKKIKKKLSCCNLVQAVFIGIRLGYITNLKG